MTFSEVIKNTIKSQYTENLVESFYKPLLSESNLYQRVSGYFSTAGLDLYIEGLEELAKNGGRVEYIISKEISAADYKKIKDGYELRDEIKTLKLAERNDKLNTKTQQQLGNLAFLIATGHARVKIAFTDKGIFHDKFGLLYSNEELVFFSGSANETHSGISKNYESISVDVSWDKSSSVLARLNDFKDRFNRLWNNSEKGVEVVEASEIAYEEIAKYQSQAQIETIEIQDDDSFIKENGIAFMMKGNSVVRYDSTLMKLTSTDRKLRPGKDLTKFFEEDNQTIKPTTTYKDIERIIKVTTERANLKDIDVVVSDAVLAHISQSKYSIEQYKILGGVYKGDLEEFPNDKLVTFEEFSKVVQEQVERPLYELHLRASYYSYEMARAANFSVPGAGKTAMILGVFAYLNRADAPQNERVRRILVISPINAMDSWKREFKAVFGSKKGLRSIDNQSSKDFKYELNTSWGISNLVLINYESLHSYVEQLKQIIDDGTMLVFDEVHRIKNPFGKRAAKALEISQIPKFKYVLTGTPIPNKYQDIYNFLHILYGNEYNSFFGWEPQRLVDPQYGLIKQINQKLYPFFWRTNKNDLQVPPVEEDRLEIVKPTEEQLELAEEIYFNESSSLAKLIRLLQASTNPSLLNEPISYYELMSYDDDGDINGISKKDFDELLDPIDRSRTGKYLNKNLNEVVSPKFVHGIELVSSIANQGKKVLVWGIFVDTLNKITNELRVRGYRVNLVYGGTDKSERVNLINEFRDGDVQILVSNPQTLGESISLHQTVHDAVYFEYDFNLTFMLQSRDRIHRLGLEPGQYTQYYYLQTKGEDVFSERPGFIDEKVYLRLKEKEEMMYDAIDNNSLAIEYSDDEILDAIKIIDEERERINKSNGKFNY